MERRLFQLVLSIFFSAALFAQVPVQQEQLRIQIWADLDPVPGLFDDNQQDLSEAEKNDSDNEYKDLPLKEKIFHQQFDYAINRSKEIAPFIINGMLDGWTFEYTPYDKARRVEEYWEFSETVPFNPERNKLTYNNPEVLNDRLVSWVYCNRTEDQQRTYKSWTSIVHPRIHGKGKGKIEDGFKGIQDAVSEATKSAVREYWRTYIKNKPKEISGKVLLIKDPRVYIKEGHYIVDLDFFLETDKIVSYNYY